MAPACTSSASARLVLPQPAWPTSAIVLIRLMEFATGLPPRPLYRPENGARSIFPAAEAALVRCAQGLPNWLNNPVLAEIRTPSRRQPDRAPPINARWYWAMREQALCRILDAASPPA